ncbi:hypothetical protein B0H17DRAFT_1138421 [Mycena rosella]|uniref:CRIM domain-containing protein n=1 Tax=Mycena rosella TaxID=1033263 RepID=A0AAD7D6M7_MYCRO|nr:hypothetical protein B0H17DRAFT_1138421 [Mycena rosella]
MFSFKPPRKLPTSTMPPASRSSNQGQITDDTYHTDDHARVAQSWSNSAPTLVEGPLPAAARRSRRNSAPVHNAFYCEVPEDPLRAALRLETVLEHPTSPLDAAGSENAVAHSLLNFSRRQVHSIQPHQSALSAMVTSHHIRNPFAAIVPVAELFGSSGSLTVEVYFPHAEQPTGQLLVLRLAANAIVEDVIALALWTYWEKRWLPELDVSKARDIDVTSWIMLVPGKDGVVNKRIAQSLCLHFVLPSYHTDDLPGKIAHFKFDKFAIVRSPRSISEKRKIEMQVSNFRRDSPPPVTVPVPERRHNRHHSLSILKSRSERPDAVSVSKLPCR